jgi:hypothetical protein
MAGFFDRVRESLDKGVTAPSVRSKELLETQQVRSKIGALQDQRRSNLEELGKAVFEMMVAGNLDEIALRAKVEEIVAIDKEIAEKEDELTQIRLRAEEALKGDTTPSPAPTAQTFVEQTAQPETEAAPATKSCANCGAQISEAAKFCPSCGSKVE